MLGTATTLLLTLATTTIPTTVASAAPEMDRAAASPHTTHPCPAGDTMMSFDNDADLNAYGAVTLTGAASITPADLVNVSKPIADYPVDPNDPSRRTHYFCNSHWKGSGAGNFWVSIGHPIVGLPAIQPTVTSPYRWAEVEFGAPGVGGTTDLTNVNAFSFPLNMQAYSSPGGSKSEESSLFRGNTCQIVNAMHRAVDRAGAGASWRSIEQTEQWAIHPDHRPGHLQRHQTAGRLAEHESLYQRVQENASHCRQREVLGRPGTVHRRGLLLRRTSRRQAGSTTRGTSHLTTASRSPAASARRHQSRRAESPEGPSPSPTLPEPSTARPRGRTPPEATTSARRRHGGRTTTTSTPWWSTIRSAPSTTATGAAGRHGEGQPVLSGRTGALPSVPTVGRPSYPSKSRAFGPAPYNIYSKVLNGFSRNYAFPYNEQYGGGGNGNPLLTLPPTASTG